MKFLHLFILTIIVASSQAQINNAYQADLTALRNTIEKTPSYKAQIKGQAKFLYDSLFERLKNDTVNIASDYKYFYNLSQLLLPIRDNHMAFSHFINDGNYKSKEAFEMYLTTDKFKFFPKVKNDIDSLKKELKAKDINKVEGIYNLDSSFLVGIFKVTDKEYIGVVLNSTIELYQHPLWEVGQIVIHLYENSPNHFRAFYADPISKGWIVQTNEKYLNHSLVNTNLFGAYYKKKYSKLQGQSDFVNLTANHPKFEFKSISNNVQYILLSTFQRNSQTSKASQEFIDLIKTNIFAPNLILDLRNNQGGASSEAKKYFRLLRNYSKKGKLFILMNNETLSQAEILLLRLKKLKNVITLGQTTKGMLTYGNNRDNQTKLPSGNYIITPTDMNGNSKLLQYENYGLKPEISLEVTTEWISQTLKIIEAK